jgi:predicted MFS family arabinose efflux permease
VNPWRGLRGLPREIWILFATALVNRAGTMALPFLVLYLTRILGMPAGSAGLALVVYGAGALCTAPLSGRLCDWVGPMRVMQASLFLSGLLLIVFPLVHGLVPILAMTLLWSLTSEAFRPANLACVTDLVAADRRKSAFAVIRLAVNLGMSVGPAIGGLLAIVSFPALFVVDGATSILAGIVLTFSAWRSAPRSRPIDNDSEAAAAEEAGGPATSPGPAASPLPAAPSSPLADRRLIWFLAAMIPVMVVFFQHAASLPLFLVQELRMPETVYGMMFPINTLLIVFLEVPLNMAMARWPHGPALALGALLCGAGFGALAFARGPAGIAATVVVWTFGEMILLPGSAAYAADIAPRHRRGQYMGLYSMAFSAAFTLGPWIGIQVFDRFGGTTLWIAAFACGALSAAMMWRVHPTAAHP